MFYIGLMVCFGINDCTYAEGLDRYKNKKVCEIELIFTVETTRLMFRKNDLEPSIAGICMEEQSI
jgi:hypothetical protein